MAALSAAIAETVAGMQRVISHEQYSSDSDEQYLRPSNYGNKLKRKSQSVSKGPASRYLGPSSPRKSIKHAGYTRQILRRNPKRYDDEGGELATEDEDEAADARAAEENPYSDIKLEQLLAPLTSAAQLPHHPSLSTPYTSTTLRDLVQHACEVVQRERKTLANAKRMLTRLRGDDIWIPAGKLQKEYDAEIFDTSKIYDTIVNNAPPRGGRSKAQNSADGIMANLYPVPETLHEAGINGVGLQDGSGTSAEQELTQDEEGVGVISIKPENDQVDKSRHRSLNGDQEDVPTTVASDDRPLSPMELAANIVLPSVENGHMDGTRDGEAAEVADTKEPMEGSKSPPRRITRAQAHADKVIASSRSETPQTEEPPPIHSLFILPASTKPDANLGLPPTEAQETRQLLALYVQKQEEICRGAEKLYEGLLQADRQCKEVLRWCKAEGHVGEMSDGEDWYDREEWGLEEDLRKGHIEEEEDTVAQGKKTRGRRA